MLTSHKNPTYDGIVLDFEIIKICRTAQKPLVFRSFAIAILRYFCYND